MQSASFIALLRGINVGGHRRIPMSDLCSLCTELGWRDVRSYIQSGNVVFRADDEAPSLEAELERAIVGRFGHSVPVIVRGEAAWTSYVGSNPFPDASVYEPNLVMLALSKSAPKHGTVEMLRERAVPGERVDQAGGALWIHYGRGVARSKLVPGLLDRIVGSPVTTRNWRTVLRLDALLHGGVL